MQQVDANITFELNPHCPVNWYEEELAVSPEVAAIYDETTRRLYEKFLQEERANRV